MQKLYINEFTPDNSKLHLFKMEIFRRIFNEHLIESWNDKIMRPNKCPEIIRRLRDNKLEKIKENYGN